MMKYFIYTCIVLFGWLSKGWCQDTTSNPVIIKRDSVMLTTNPAFTDTTAITKDTTPNKVLKTFSPRKATIRSAILPGWGQAYTKRYLMIPVVYAALGVPAGFFIYNNTWYKRTRLAYEIKLDRDTSRFGEIHRDIVELSPESLRFYRNEFRRNRDYSVLFFLLAWGLNVVDATVFAHLKEFDVSDDLSLKIKPNIDLRNTGFSLVLAPKSTTKHRLLPSR